MKRVITLCVLLVASIIGAAHYRSNTVTKRTDKYVRNRVLMITGVNEECTAVEIKAPSGKIYTLSAAHCRGMQINGMVMARTEDGYTKAIKIIDVDVEHDLMLLEAVDHNSIDVAKTEHAHQHIHTITHGKGMPAYRTDGELLEPQTIEVGEPITDDEDLKACTATPYRRLMLDGFDIVCEIKLTVVRATAMVVPGSSGGPALNDAGQLIGIVSCTDGFFSGLVPLQYIKRFLADR